MCHRCHRLIQIDRLDIYLVHDVSRENGSVSGATMYDPAGQHPKRAPLVIVEAHPPPHNVPLNPLLPNTIQTQKE
jgi:hypothetical protein